MSLTGHGHAADARVMFSGFNLHARLPTIFCLFEIFCVKPISLAIPPRSSRLRICCKTQIISSFHLCSDLVTAFVDYIPTSKLLIVLRNSRTSFNLPHCSYKLYKQSFVNRCLFRDCYWHVCYLLCGTYMLFDLIWFVIIFLHIIGWHLFVSINDMLCYVISTSCVSFRHAILISIFCPSVRLSVCLSHSDV